MGAAGGAAGGGLLENMKAEFVVSGGSSSTGPNFNMASFNSTGTKIYGVTYLNPTYTLREYTLSSPWDISYASETASKVLTGQHTGAPYFTADGLSMYITWRVDSVAPKIYQYSLSTAWDITTLTKVGEATPSQATDGTSLNAITFKPDGSVIYFGGGNGYTYSAPLSTPWNITTLGTVTTLNTTAYPKPAKSIQLSSDGTKLYLPCSRNSVNSPAAITIYTLSTAWNLSTATFTSITNISTFSYPKVLEVVQNGSKLIHFGYTFNTTNGNTWMQGTLTTPWDASTFTLTPNSGNRTSLTTTGSGVTYSDLDFTSDGLGLFALYFQSPNSYVISHTLSTPWDVSTRSAITGTQLVATSTNKAGLLLTPDKTKYLTTSSGTLNEYTMSTPGVAVATLTSQYTNSTGYSFNGSMCWNSNGTKLFVFANNGSTSTRRILEFSLPTPYSISGMTFAGVRITLPSSPDGSNTFGLGFIQSGKVFYAATTNYLFKYNLATAWDLTTATFANTYKVDWWDYAGLLFKIGDDGKKAFFLSNGSNITTVGYPVNPKGALYGFTL